MRIRPGRRGAPHPTRSVLLPGRYGFTVIATNGEAALVHALPGEYLQRLLLANRVFDDDIRLVGVVRETAGMALITSQPTIVGTAATREEMNTYFRARGFDPLPGLRVGHRGALSFYRDLDRVVAFDIHPANILKDRRGIVFPIDAIVLAADEELGRIVERLRERA